MNAKEIFESGLNEFKAQIEKRFDELNVLKTEAVNASTDSTQKEDFLDDFLEYLITAYEDGNLLAEDMLDKKFKVDQEKMLDALDRKIADKTYKDRIDENLNDLEGMKRLADTEYHRMFNTAIYDGAVSNGGKYKTWATMLDDRVRESHQYLNGTKIDIDKEFYTYTGAHGLYPSGFNTPEEDINCRCYLIIE